MRDTVRSFVGVALVMAVLVLSAALVGVSNRLAALEQPPGDHLHRRALAESTEAGGEAAEAAACHSSSDIAMLAMDAATAVQQAHAILLAGLQTKADEANVTAVAQQISTLSRSLLSLATEIGGKADSDSIQALSDAIDGKASATTVATGLAQKAEQDDLNAVATAVETKAEQSDVDTLAAAVDTKASTADTTAALGVKADQADLTVLTSVVDTKANSDDVLDHIRRLQQESDTPLIIAPAAASTVNCEGHWSACTAARKPATERVWMQTQTPSGFGTACPSDNFVGAARADCGVGDGGCMDTDGCRGVDCGTGAACSDAADTGVCIGAGAGATSAETCGTCSDASGNTEATCTGTCSDAGQTTEETCGSCSDASGTTSGTCTGTCSA